MDELNYREYKIILTADRFGEGRHTFARFRDIVFATAKALKIGLLKPPSVDFRVREVRFFDTPDGELYRNHFILRFRRGFTNYWPDDVTELALKYRHPDFAMAQTVDPRAFPQGPLDRIKFKEELLPPKDGGAGIRSIYSHNLISPTLQIPDDRSFKSMSHFLPALAAIKVPAKTEILQVGTVVEEVLLELGELDFGGGIKAKTNVAIWRDRGTHEILCGEYAYQIKFKKGFPGNAPGLKLSEKFLQHLQIEAPEWMLRGVTKTALVYARTGVGGRAHE